MSYYGLHNHTEFSNLRMLDTTNKLSNLIDEAIKIGLKGIAITDHESVSGYIRAIHIQKKLMEQGSDFRIFLGDEIYLVDSLEEARDNYKPKVTKFFHFILIAKDEIGCEQIRKISSKAWSNSFYTGKMERTPVAKTELEAIIGEEKGHIVATTACIGSELAHWILSNNPDKCLEFIDWCQNVFLTDNFYLEMQPNDSPEQVKVNQTIIKISEQLDIPYIVTTDTHYLRKDQAKIHEAYLNSREDESRETLEFYASCYLMTSKEIHEWMDKQIGKECVDIALNNTHKVAEQIEFYDLDCPTIVPDTKVPEFKILHTFKDYYDKFIYIKKFAYSDNEYDRYLLSLIERGFLDKYNNKSNKPFSVEEQISRIEDELSEMWKVTEKLGTSISSYYLTTLDLVNTMWEEGDSLVGVARGSVTGMYTMYLIGITQISPLPYNLKHWRHISASKIELSDVDLDSERSRRDLIIKKIKEKRGFNKVLNCCTFKTEGSKSAILSACRGMEIDSDEAQYIASLIPQTRGFTWSINDCLYGNEEEDRKPVTEFKTECEKFEGLLETALTIEGIICGRSIHASAVYLYNEDYTKHNAMMKAPNGVFVTQWNMKDSDAASGLKMDLLTVKSLDRIRKCMDYLLDYGYMEWQGSLRDTYNKYLHPDVLDYDSPKMWEMLGEEKIQDIFQFETNIGKEAVKKIKPKSLVELATASSVMRLMKPEGEQPMDTYIRYKNDVNEWYKSMRQEYKLTEDEIRIMEKYLLEFYGIGATQEDVMLISMDKDVCGFDVKNSNLLRKGISKKDKALQQQMKELLFKNGRELGTSDNLLNYVWNEVISLQLGYSFSQNHTVPYACIALQEMNLAYHYPIVYWNAACLTVNAGSDEDMENNKSTQYDKVGVATTTMKLDGINITHPVINKALFGFKPDEEKNSIIYAIKAINGIGDEDAEYIIKNRPYKSFADFCDRMVTTKIITRSKMIKLIKAGCFDEFERDRTKLMETYLRDSVFSPVSKLTLSQFNEIKRFGIIPEDLKIAEQMVIFKRYVLDDSALVEKHIDENKKLPKCGYHDLYYTLDESSQAFFIEHLSDYSVVKVENGFYIISQKKFLKEIEDKIYPMKLLFHSEEFLALYNQKSFEALWDSLASGSVEKWSMEALSFYDGKHELEGMNNDMYGVVNFFELPEEPEPYDYWTQYINGEPKYIPKYKISRLAGTILATDNNRHTVTILTLDGVVNVKFPKGQYAFYKKQISVKNEETGKKTVVEKSWLKRGNIIIVCGMRRGDQFFIKNYRDTVYKHTVNLIKEIHSDGTLELQVERTNV